MIQERIKDDIKKAMYDKNKSTLSLLRTVIGEFDRKGKKLSDNDAIQVNELPHRKGMGNSFKIKKTFKYFFYSEYLFIFVL